MIARRIENLLELDYPARQARDRRHARTPRAIGPRRSRCSSRACGSSRNPRGGKVAAQDRAVRADRRRDRRLLGRERDLGARRAAQARPRVRRSGGRVRLRPAADPRGRRVEQGGLYWRYEMGVRARRVAARLGDRRQRLDLRGAPRRLRRGRPALRPRPVAAVPDGAARPAGGLRAARRRRSRSRRRRTRPSTAARCGCSSTAG